MLSETGHSTRIPARISAEEMCVGVE